jgi:hypothetical protein
MIKILKIYQDECLFRELSYCAFLNNVSDKLKDTFVYFRYFITKIIYF